MRPVFSQKTRLFLAERANRRCEYCLFHEDDLFLPFEIDHIISLKHGGGSELDNLAYTCPHCNQHKGTDLTTFVDYYDDIVVLFNPRKHLWREHFQIVAGEIVGKTKIGLGSIKVFRFNHPDLVVLRQIMVELGHLS